MSPLEVIFPICLKIFGYRSLGDVVGLSAVFVVPVTLPFHKELGRPDANWQLLSFYVQQFSQVHSRPSV